MWLDLEVKFRINSIILIASGIGNNGWKEDIQTITFAYFTEWTLWFTTWIEEGDSFLIAIVLLSLELYSCSYRARIFLWNCIIFLAFISFYDSYQLCSDNITFELRARVNFLLFFFVRFVGELHDILILFIVNMKL